MKSTMPVNCLVGLLSLLQLAACAATETPEPAATAPQSQSITTAPPVTTPESTPAPAPVAAIKPSAPVATPVTAAPAPDTKSAGTEKPATKPPAKAATPARTPPPPVPQKNPVAAPAPAAPPPMALATLEQRLKDTDAIGVFTKIALKNQVDDLLSRAKAHHQSNGNPTLAQLRQSYDQLLAKVHGLLKDGDPALASAIIGSREALWAVLTDPVKFAQL